MYQSRESAYATGALRDPVVLTTTIDPARRRNASCLDANRTKDCLVMPNKWSRIFLSFLIGLQLSILHSAFTEQALAQQLVK